MDDVLQLAVQKRVTTSERIFKLTDDTYLVIPAVNSRSCVYERQSHIKTGTSNNNLKLNRGTRWTGGGIPQRGPGAEPRWGSGGIGGSRIFLEGVTLGTRASEASEH